MKTACDKYKDDNRVSYVHFSVFVKFLRDLARLRNDPSLVLENLFQSQPSFYPTHRKRTDIHVYKITVASDHHENHDSDTSIVRCPIHGGNPNHALQDCQKLQKEIIQKENRFSFCQRILDIA